MQKENWYSLAPTLSKQEDGTYDSKFGIIIGYVVDKDNIATCYQAGEERKYKAAVTKAKKKDA